MSCDHVVIRVQCAVVHVYSKQTLKQPADAYLLITHMCMPSACGKVVIKEKRAQEISSSGQIFSTFKFLFSWHNRTFLLNENQRTLLRSQCRQLQFSLHFSQQLQKWAKNSNVIYTLPDCDIFRSLFFLIQPLLQKEIQLIKVKCVGSNKSLNPAITKWSHIFHRTASLLLYLTLH